MQTSRYEKSSNSPREEWNRPPQRSVESKRVIAGILALFFGSLGVHKFVLGYEREGALLLVLTAVGIATACIIVGIPILCATGIVSFVEGIIYLTKTDEEFYQEYQVNKKPWF